MGGRAWEVFCFYSLRKQQTFRDATTGSPSRSKFRGETIGGRVTKCYPVYRRPLLPQEKNRERRRRLLSRFFPEGGGDVCTQATKCRLFCGFSGYCVYFSIFSHCSTFTLLHVTYGLLVLALPFRPSFLCLQRNLSPPLNQTKLTKLSDCFDINLS